MTTKRWASAAKTISDHYERQFTETQNPFYVMKALERAHHYGFEPPMWALERLLDAVNVAATMNDRTGERLSIDATLGLKVSRGKTTPERQAYKHGVEEAAFQIVDVIHACFDVSIASSRHKVGACEIVYGAINPGLVWRCWEQVLDLSTQGTDGRYDGLTVRERIDRLTARDRAAFDRLADRLAAPEYVREKIRSGQWWTITNGDVLGYSLDQFTDRYYRECKRREARKYPDWNEQHLFATVNFLVHANPIGCTNKVDLSDRYIPWAESALKGLPMRPDFARYMAALSEPSGTVSKCDI